jgi:hypothetical protein
MGKRLAFGSPLRPPPVSRVRDPDTRPKCFCSSASFALDHCGSSCSPSFVHPREDTSSAPQRWRSAADS